MPSGVDSVEKRKLKSTSSVPGMMLLAPVAGVHVRDLEARRREVFVAAVPLDGGELRQRRQRRVNRIAARARDRRCGTARR